MSFTDIEDLEFAPASSAYSSHICGNRPAFNRSELNLERPTPAASKKPRLPAKDLGSRPNLPSRVERVERR